MKLKNLYREYRTAIIKSRFMGYDAKTGKILFDSLHDRDDSIARFSEYAVTAVWAEVVTERGSGYMQVARPTIKIQLYGGTENED